MPSRSRWLVGSSSKQEIGVTDKLTGQGDPFPPAAGEDADLLRRVLEPDLAERDADLRVALVLFEIEVRGRFEDGILDRLVAVERRLLRQEADARLAEPGDLAGIGRLQPREDAEQRRLAGPVGTDQADPLAVADIDRDVGEQGARARTTSSGPGSSEGHSCANRLFDPRPAQQPIAGVEDDRLAGRDRRLRLLEIDTHLVAVSGVTVAALGVEA